MVRLSGTIAIVKNYEAGSGIVHSLLQPMHATGCAVPRGATSEASQRLLPVCLELANRYCLHPRRILLKFALSIAMCLNSGACSTKVFHVVAQLSLTSPIPCPQIGLSLFAWFNHHCRVSG